MKDIFEKISVKYKYILTLVGGLIAILAVVLILVFITAGNDENELGEGVGKEDIQDNENVVRGEFTNVMGYNGYTLRDKSAVYPHITRYYAVEGEKEFLIAESWNFEDKEDDYIIDIDEDGITELVCNCTYGDGGQSVVVYKRDGCYTYKGAAGDFSTINYVNTGVIRPMKFYNSTENVVEILYHEDADGELLCTKQELTWDIIEGWTLYSDTTEEKREQAYITVLENVLYYQTFPDGIDRGYDEFGTNKFSICDIDEDGEKELIIVYTTTYMAGQVILIYDYDMETDSVREQFAEYPWVNFYKNGVIEAKASHNHGRASDAEDFWPYTLYKYDKKTDTYVRFANVDAWNKSYMSEDNEGKSFPDDVDVDGDGRIYSIMTGNEYTWENPVDNWKYKVWRESYIYSDSANIKISYKELNEENIRWLKMVD